MAATDWYRSETWDDDVRDRFEAKLGRARPAGRAQYIRVQAVTLLATADDQAREAGARLLERLLDEYPDAGVEIEWSHDFLARYAEEVDDRAGALSHYEAARRIRKSGDRQLGGDVRFAELIIRDGMAERYDQADRVLDDVRDDHSVIFVSEQFRYAVARMRLDVLRGENDRAAAYAHGALWLFEHNRPVSSYHPTIGLARVDDATRDELEAVAAIGSPEVASPFVADYRLSDGSVSWEWSLISRLHGIDQGSALEASEQRRQALQPLAQDLRAAGFEITSVDAWARCRLPDAAAVRLAGPVLLRHLERSHDPDVKAVIARALNDRRFERLATHPLLREFAALTAPEINASGAPPDEDIGRLRRYKSALAGALETVARDAVFEDLAVLVRDERHGGYRAYLWAAVAYMKDERAVDLAIEMLDGDSSRVVVLRTLADLRSLRAEPVLARIAAEERPRGRSDDDQRQRSRVDLAHKGLQKLAKARAAGKARP